MEQLGHIMRLMTVQGAAEVEAFLRRYRDVRLARSGENVRDLAVELSRLRPGFEVARDLRSQRARQAAPGFDILTVLGVANKESAHSNLLADLLKPAGRHGQGSLFFHNFLITCAHAGGAFSPHLLKSDAWADKIRVIREATIFEGRCDLILNARGHFCMIIENKIEASEEETQLVRYRDWLAKRPEPADRKVLIFLTPEGRVAKGIRKDECICLSYGQHVRECLERSLPAIEAAHVRSVVQQYLGLLQAWKRRQDAGSEI